MKETTELSGVHPAGEGVFTFPTAGGRVRLSVSDDALTPFGGLVPWAAFIKHVEVAERLAEDCPVRRTSPNAAPVYDVIESFMLTALTDGRRFSHIERLREDPMIPELFGMEAVVGDDTVRRFFKSVDPVACGDGGRPALAGPGGVVQPRRPRAGPRRGDVVGTSRRKIGRGFCSS